MRVPASGEKVGVLALGDAFILTRPQWFAAQLSIPPDSVHAKLANLTDSLFLAGLQSQWPLAMTVPAGERDRFAHETQKLDEKIYLKVQFPPQGHVIQAMGEAPDYLLIVHEYTIGTDLQREAFYDYRLANQEIKPHKSIDNLSVVVSFTFWDNRKQIPLYSSVSEVQFPLRAEKLDLSQFSEAALLAARQCVQLLREAR